MKTSQVAARSVIEPLLLNCLQVTTRVGPCFLHRFADQAKTLLIVCVLFTCVYAPLAAWAIGFFDAERRRQESRSFRIPQVDPVKPGDAVDGMTFGTTLGMKGR
jgi:hypothetical protein